MVLMDDGEKEEEGDEEKVSVILHASDQRDYEALKRLASSEKGFVRDDVRRSVCQC